jgi:uncharacterized protein YndB with AHSA1/START domain
MKTTIYSSLVLVTIFCVVGCDKGHDHGPAPKGGAVQTHDAHAALHTPKYNEVLVEFPGHKFAMEIIDEKETTGLVTAILTDAHFGPVAVDAKEVRLNFVIDGNPKTFTLTRTEQEEGKPATFTLTDKELATLNCEGWQGEATASVEIDGTPYSAKLVKLGGHDHGHAH